MVLYERDKKNLHVIERLLVLEFLRMANSSVDRSMKIDFNTNYIYVMSSGHFNHPCDFSIASINRPCLEVSEG